MVGPKATQGGITRQFSVGMNGGVRLAQEIDWKLRLTAAHLGAASRKELAAAFRRVNANTTFDIGRADKWLQGRAQPRHSQVYEDWALVLELNQPGQWIADCSTNAFIDEICKRHARNRKALLRDMEKFGRRRRARPPDFLSLAGRFVCYSHAWSSHNRGRLIRGELMAIASSWPTRLRATYKEVVPTGVLRLEGSITVGKRATHGCVGEDSSGIPIFTFCLFPAFPPASVLGGLMFGSTLLGATPQPFASRIVMVRLPATAPERLLDTAFLPAKASIAEDLAKHGLQTKDSAMVDQHLSTFLMSDASGLDHVSGPAYRALTEIFDPIWLPQMP